MRFMAQHILSGEWLTRDLPLTDFELQTALSAPTSITGTLPPGYNEATNINDPRPLEDWATMVYAVHDTLPLIYGHGIVVPPTQYEDRSRITCMGVSGYPNGYIMGEHSFLLGPEAEVKPKKNEKGKIINAAQVKPGKPRQDPIEVWRFLWTFIQNQPQSNLNVVIAGDASTRNKPGYPAMLIGTYAEPVRFRWFETPDLGAVMSTLMEETPFEFSEKARFTDLEARTVEQVLVTGYPRLGKRRTDLRFALGENIAVAPAVQTIDGAANAIIGIGNGEPGPRMVNSSLSWNDGRLRRFRVLTDKTVKRGSSLRNRIDVYRQRFEARYDITSVAIVDHRNAPFTQINMGDDILLEFDHPEYGYVRAWVRVLAMTRGTDDSSAVLTTANSAFYNYMRPQEELS